MAAPKKPIKKVAKKTTPAQRNAELKQAIEERVVQIRQLRDSMAEAKETVDDLQAEVLADMEALGQDTLSIKTADGSKYKVTRVQSQGQPVINEPRLRKKLGVALWNKVSTRVLDKNKLKALVASGDIKASVLAECSDTPPPNKPYVKVT